ncbi:hypothetical protein EJ05DRAFT_475714 [Pseudovirgaria hyperparasitica]|uniref:Mid2 domain-containing protein n=1 Tax=Pseudovirgaria hyperparasitica TaxID=470096 RepID=A0A6A6WBA9_9PEZI|nr:uncharacterized protein EJ05DRAFT_475714 [Pseudovirgaria hyperparasitica]KAF2758391.1 hypothetical protein EJ05DRAFT_475714 [Pseudovirgaria hyperparasitica]
MAEACYSDGGSMPDLWLRCGERSPAAANNCCALNTTYPNGIDVCLQNGLCGYNNPTTGIFEYWKDPCSDPTGAGCLELNCTALYTNLNVPGIYPVHPCGSSWSNSTKWCCGTDDSCCEDETRAESVRWIATVFGAAVATVPLTLALSSETRLARTSIPTALSTTSTPTVLSAPSSTAEDPLSSASLLSRGAKVGIGIAAASAVFLLCLGVFILWRARTRRQLSRDYKAQAGGSAIGHSGVAINSLSELADKSVVELDSNVFRELDSSSVQELGTEWQSGKDAPVMGLGSQRPTKR